LSLPIFSLHIVVAAEMDRELTDKESYWFSFKILYSPFLINIAQEFLGFHALLAEQHTFSVMQQSCHYRDLPLA